jgi:hypothetical protein
MCYEPIIITFKIQKQKSIVKIILVEIFISKKYYTGRIFCQATGRWCADCRHQCPCRGRTRKIEAQRNIIMDTNTTAVAQTWLMNMHRIGLVSFPSLPCHRKMSHSHTPAHYYYTYIPAAAAAAEAQRAAQIKYTHTRRAYLSMLIRNTHRLLLFQMQREKFCIKHGHTGNFLMPRAQKRVQKSSFVRAAQIRSCREGIL